MASERLKELQEMERQLQSQSGAETGEIAPLEISIGGTTLRVEDSGEADSERKKLLRRATASRDRGGGLGASRLWIIVSVTIVSCVMLLWALFSGSAADKYVSPPAAKPLASSELKQQHSEGVREDACPEAWWLPEECLDERRLKSKTANDRCLEIFDDYDYTLELLQECGLIKTAGG